MTSSKFEQALHFSRRAFLQAGGVSAFGLSLPQLTRSQTARAAGSGAPTAKSCIMLYMIGGPPQHETFDMKPEADVGVRGEFSPISTTVPGLQICEHLPRLANLAKHYSLIRSVHHDGTFHATGVHYNLTGWKHAPRNGQPLLSRRDSPSIGGVLQQHEGGRGELPTAVQLPMWITQDGPGQEWAGQHAGFLGPRYDPLIMDYKGGQPGTLPPDFVPGAENIGPRFERRVDLLRSLDRNVFSSAMPAELRLKLARQEAMGVLRSSPKWQAFCIDDEAQTTRDRFGDHHFGRSCLVARRLVEAGVRLVTVAWPITKEFPHFDTHADNFPTMKKNLPPMDQGISALLEDLMERGLLDETLVVCTGEFGRTPSINPNGGRDHWGSVYSTLFAGGGIRGGQVYGSSDKNGAVPKDNPVHVSDFVATIYHALGYDRNTKVIDYSGRPHYIVQGRPVMPLFG
ncbi:MAG: DUF1501 domain-containing protein [Planctomycetes bacterium]|nr:DUF1501 domain-containing protein [Planctomycetota bacterium]